MNAVLDAIQPAELPAGWESTTLGAIAPAEYGKGLTAKARRPGPVSVLASAGVVGEHDEALVEDGDIIVVGRKGAAGRVTLARGPAWIIDTAYFIRVPEGINAKFLAFQLQAAGLEALDQSTAVPSLSRDHLHRVAITLPTLDEQERIVEIVDELMAQISEGWRLINESRYGCSRLRAALLGQLTDASFPRVRIGDIAKVFVGATPSRKEPSFWNGDVPWVSSGEVSFRRISSTRETITEAGLGNPDTRLHPPGTVLLAMIGEGKTRGQAAILDVAAAHNQNCASIRVDRTKMLPEFLYFCLMGAYEKTRRAGSGSQQPALNGSLVRAIETPCPPVDVQATLVKQVDRQLQELEDLEAVFQRQSVTAAKLKASILSQAFSGSWRP